MWSLPMQRSTSIHYPRTLIQTASHSLRCWRFIESTHITFVKSLLAFNATAIHFSVSTLYFIFLQNHSLVPYHSIPYHTILYQTILYHTTPYHTIPYHTIPLATFISFHFAQSLEPFLMIYLSTENLTMVINLDAGAFDMHLICF